MSFPSPPSGIPCVWTVLGASPEHSQHFSLKVCRVMVANTCLLGSSSERPFCLSPGPYSVTLQFGKVMVMGYWHLGAYGRNSVCGLGGGGSSCQLR